jgi:hypothetical protein
MEFRSENKFRGIDSERFQLFRGRKHSFRGIPSSAEELIPKLGTEKISLMKRKQNNLTKCCWFLFLGMDWNGILRVYFYFLLHGKEFRVVFSSAERFGKEFRELASILVHGTEYRAVFSSVEGFGTELCEFASIFALRNRIPSYFLFWRRVRNGIPRFSVLRNNRNSVGNNHLFRLFRLPRNYFFVRNSQPYPR